MKITQSLGFHPTLHDPVKLCSETRIADISKRLRSASPLQIWRSCFSDFQVRSWSDCEVSRTSIHCNIFNQFGRAFHFKAKHFWESTRISRAASPPGCDPVRSPMCGCTPTVDRAVTSQMWIDIEIVSQYFGCEPHWACTNSRRSYMVLMRASWIMDPHYVAAGSSTLLWT